MKQEIQHIRSVAEYNESLGIETLHPLVSVIDFSKAHPMRHSRHTFGFYAVFLKDVKCGDILYGRQYYDYQEGTIVCFAPGQVVGVEDNGEVFQPKGWALIFDPDLIRGTSLGRNIKEYRFFSYAANEALHLSDKEREIFLACLDNVSVELNHAIDRLSKRLIANNIELLLNYCMRFYERQFITREVPNHDILMRFENLLDKYLSSDKLTSVGVPTVKYCASELCLSPNYFGDLIKRETGHTAQEHIHYALISKAKEKLLMPDESVSEIAYALGFKYPQHFTRLFKKLTGETPMEFRLSAYNHK